MEIQLNWQMQRSKALGKIKIDIPCVQLEVIPKTKAGRGSVFGSYCAEETALKELSLKFPTVNWGANTENF